jgi:hypothetical protein
MIEKKRMASLGDIVGERRLSRIEVSVRGHDVALVRQVARCLAADGPTAARLRAIISQATPAKSRLNFAEWQASEDDDHGS